MKSALGTKLPPDILHRKKRGFGTPMGAWLKGELAHLLDRILSPEVIRQRNLFDVAVVSQLIADHRANRQDYTEAIVALINFEIWARIYLDRRSHEDVTAELHGLLT